MLLAENGSLEAVEIWEAADDLVTGRLTYIEGRAALAAASRSGRLLERKLEGAKKAFEDRWRELRIIDLDDQLAREAAEVAEEHRLRSNDAVHLATALAVATITMATWDAELRRAALEAGFALAPA